MTDDHLSPSELLGFARAILSSPGVGLDARWPRSVALLTRGSLEIALAQFWQSHEPPIGGAPMRTQTLCLTGYANPGTSARAAYLFSALSSACHYHPYELAPTAQELLSWIESVERLSHDLLDTAEIPG